MEILSLFPAVLRLVGHRGLGHLSIVCLWRVYMSVKTLVLLTGHDQVMNFCCMSNKMSTVKIKPDVVIANGPQEENYFTSIKTNVLPAGLLLEFTGPGIKQDKTDSQSWFWGTISTTYFVVHILMNCVCQKNIKNVEC